jgi:hypothetical protein
VTDIGDMTTEENNRGEEPKKEHDDKP